MSAAVSTTKDVPYNAHLDEELKNKGTNKVVGEPHQLPYSDDAEEIEQEEEEHPKLELDLGPQFSLKEQLEKDKDDESLRKWKEQLLGSIDMSAIGENKDPEVKIVSLTITCPGRPDLILPIPFTGDSKKSIFTLKEGSQYRLKFSFTVSNNIVSGLKYSNVVWKTGVRVDNTKKMLGTYSPRQEPYTYELEDDTTPSGLFARGTYSARTKFVDDDRKCYLDTSYHFEIQKNWPTHI
ncbi:rho GDP-dissociation inhibitor 1-like isoform X2 [Abrus precatorius]|uniref:Rho GDP-dissociation inhibitor 1-like isoform X2 n=1 Tax=Abrus precatorius TaxID=3816 RepID=A0A8B8KHX0_ABRPR|nr:rho GDP-dissociation inhibitor 1-like isoform X2 [Abrus precatorius]